MAKLNLGEVKLETMLASRLMREHGASQGFAGAQHFYRSPVEVKPVASVTLLACWDIDLFCSRSSHPSGQVWVSLMISFN